MTTVTYTSPRTGDDVTVTGTLVEGRYPDMYLTLDTHQGVEGVLRIPVTAVVDVCCQHTNSIARFDGTAFCYDCEQTF